MSDDGIANVDESVTERRSLSTSSAASIAGEWDIDVDVDDDHDRDVVHFRVVDEHDEESAAGIVIRVTVMEASDENQTQHLQQTPAESRPEKPSASKPKYFRPICLYDYQL